MSRCYNLKVNLYIGMSRVVAPKAKVCKRFLAFAQTGILTVPYTKGGDLPGVDTFSVLLETELDRGIC